MEISLCMIVKNEEEVLQRCLDSVKEAVDEIIIVDTGSEDNTVSIAEKNGAKVFYFDWCDDFSQARNFSFSQSTKEYILWLDADDYLSEENLNKLIQLKQEWVGAYDIVNMVYSLNRDESGMTTCGLRRNRLIKKDKNFQWIGRIHEYLEVFGSYYYSDVEIFHDKHKSYTDRNLQIYRKMKEQQIPFSVRDLFYYGNELFYNDFLEEAIQQYHEFLSLGKGWIEDRKNAVINWIACLNRLNRKSEILEIAFQSFQWSKPHPEVCCRIAEVFMEQGQYQEGIFWYETAMRCVPDADHLALVIKDYYTFIPAIQICVCYSMLGKYDLANHFNEMAGVFQSDSPKVAHNRAYLKQMIEQK